jgi:hypothetical protein
MMVVVDAPPPPAAATLNYMDVDTDGNRVDTTTVVTMYSAQERKWLNEKVCATLLRQFTVFRTLPGCEEPAAIEPLSQPEKIAIDCAVQFYHEKRVERQWTETGQALIDHVIADADFRQDPRLVEVWKLRIAARPEETTEDNDLFAGNNILFSGDDFETYDSDSDFAL